MGLNSISTKDIQEQLELILESNDFAASDRFRNFLRFVLEETLAGREEELKAYTIATEVFGRNKHFNPLLDPVVRVEASKLRNKLEQFYLRRKGKNKDKIFIEIPRGTYVPTFSLIEESSDPTPHSNNDNELVATRKDFHGNMPKNLSGAPLLMEEGADNFPRAAIAILPFTNISSSQELEYLNSGLAEELAIALTKFEDLRIISAHAMNIDPVANVYPNELSNSLSARFILSGSTQLDSNIIRMRVKLSDTVTHTTLWADKFDEPYTATGVFEIIDTIVSRVASQAGDGFGYIKQVLFSEAPSQRTGEIKAFEAILYYHHWSASLAEDRFMKAKEALDKAILADPRYCLAYGMLADIYAVHYQWSYNLFPNDLEMSQKLSKRAVELDPHCQYAQWSKAYACYLTHDKDQFVYLARLAVRLNPGDTNILAVAGQKLAMAGNWEEGLELMRKAEKLNPFLPSWFRTAVFTYYLQNNDMDAALREARQISTPAIAGPMLRAAVLGAMGQKDEAKTELQSLLCIRPSFRDDYQEIFRRIFFQDSITKTLLKGLRDAGI